MMKKLMIIVGLCFAAPVFAMELSMITEQDAQYFDKHLKMALGFIQKKVDVNEISSDNSMYKIMSQMSDTLAAYKGDLVKMIKEEEGLHVRFGKYKSIDSEPLVKLGLDQIRDNKGDIKAAKEYVKRTRILLSDIILKKNQKTYSNVLIGDVKPEDRLDFMKRNENYPLDELAVKEYTVAFIYQLLFAQKID